VNEELNLMCIHSVRTSWHLHRLHNIKSITKL